MSEPMTDAEIGNIERAVAVANTAYSYGRTELMTVDIPRLIADLRRARAQCDDVMRALAMVVAQAGGSIIIQRSTIEGYRDGGMLEAHDDLATGDRRISIQRKEPANGR